MIEITGRALAKVVFAAAPYIKRGAICRACKRVNGQWRITLAFPATTEQTGV